MAVFADGAILGRRRITVRGGRYAGATATRHTLPKRSLVIATKTEAFTPLFDS